MATERRANRHGSRRRHGDRTVLVSHEGVELPVTVVGWPEWPGNSQFPWIIMSAAWRPEYDPARDPCAKRFR